MNIFEITYENSEPRDIIHRTYEVASEKKYSEVVKIAETKHKKLVSVLKTSEVAEW